MIGPAPEGWSCRADRAEPDGGFMAVAYVLVLAVTAFACLSLLVDGGRIVSARRQAATTAFQAARAAAQHLDADALRRGVIVVDAGSRQVAADATSTLLRRSGLEGRMSGFVVDGSRVTVTVEIERSLTASALFGFERVAVSSSATVRAGAGVTEEEVVP